MLLHNLAIVIQELHAPLKSRWLLPILLLHEPKDHFEIHPSAVTVRGVLADFEVLCHVNAVLVPQGAAVQQAFERREHNLLHILVGSLFFLIALSAAE